MRAKKMNGNDLSKATGFSRGQISNYLSGRNLPNQKNTFLLAKVLDVDPAWLMGFDINLKWDGNDPENFTIPFEGRIVGDEANALLHTIWIAMTQCDDKKFDQILNSLKFIVTTIIED